MIHWAASRTDASGCLQGRYSMVYGCHLLDWVTLLTGLLLTQRPGTINKFPTHMPDPYVEPASNARKGPGMYGTSMAAG